MVGLRETVEVELLVRVAALASRRGVGFCALTFANDDLQKGI